MGREPSPVALVYVSSDRCGRGSVDWLFPFAVTPCGQIIIVFPRFILGVYVTVRPSSDTNASRLIWMSYTLGGR